VSKPLIDLFARFEHLEVGSPLERSIHSAVAPLELETSSSDDALVIDSAFCAPPRRIGLLTRNGAAT
jgi:hypothetical protein